MARYTADGRRKSSMGHANHPHTCPGCGKICMGNGYANHKTACIAYKERIVIGTCQGCGRRDSEIARHHLGQWYCAECWPQDF